MTAPTGRRRSSFPDKRRAYGGSVDPPRRLTPAEVQKRYRERLKAKQKLLRVEDIWGLYVGS